MSHPSGSPFRDGDGTLVVELAEADDIVHAEPVEADTLRLTINSDSHDYVRDSVARFAVTAGAGNDRVEMSALLDILGYADDVADGHDLERHELLPKGTSPPSQPPPPAGRGFVVLCLVGRLGV